VANQTVDTLHRAVTNVAHTDSLINANQATAATTAANAAAANAASSTAAQNAANQVAASQFNNQTTASQTSSNAMVFNDLSQLASNHMVLQINMTSNTNQALTRLFEQDVFSNRFNSSQAFGFGFPKCDGVGATPVVGGAAVAPVVTPVVIPVPTRSSDEVPEMGNDIEQLVVDRPRSI
jgi:hypothetical protein